MALNIRQKQCGEYISMTMRLPDPSAQALSLAQRAGAAAVARCCVAHHTVPLHDPPSPHQPPPPPPQTNNPADALVRMLSLSADGRAPQQPAAGAAAGSELYKVLVLDRFCRDVVAPLLRVSELRKHGVTLHLNLEAERQPIADVPAVYLLQPSARGAERVAADIAAGLYDALHLNFATAVPNRMLETIASGAITSGNLGRVARVCDQYVSFIALEPSLFSLGLPGSYVELNDPAARDTQIEVGWVGVSGGGSRLVVLVEVWGVVVACGIQGVLGVGSG